MNVVTELANEEHLLVNTFIFQISVIFSSDLVKSTVKISLILNNVAYL